MTGKFQSSIVICESLALFCDKQYDLMRDCEATKSIYNLLLVLIEFRQVLQYKEEITSI